MEVMKLMKHVPMTYAITRDVGNAQVNLNVSIRGQCVMARLIVKREEMKVRTCVPKNFVKATSWDASMVDGNVQMNQNV